MACDQLITTHEQAQEAQLVPDKVLGMPDYGHLHFYVSSDDQAKQDPWNISYRQIRELFDKHGNMPYSVALEHLQKEGIDKALEIFCAP